MAIRHGRQLPQFPKSHRERIEDAQRGMDFYTSQAGVDPIPLGPPLPPKRKYERSDRPLENDAKKAILHLLARHPKVAFVGRFNRGRFAVERNGRRGFYSMNTIPGFSDIHGMLKSGRPFYIEVKRDEKEKPTEDQRNFLELAERYGALTMVAWDAEQVYERLKHTDIA